ncbi:hypothetical protein PG994_005963 [Apiospora phragmitis]|uniref:Polyketide synthase n=1 Tax=Apiospora phragmitis TaxID=2905665 RepID=A0ABR1VDQ1_9PEZI
MAPGLLYTESPPSSSGDSDFDGSKGIDDQNLTEPIAVVGLSLKFPQDATSPEAFWQMLLEKRCASTETPPDRFNVNAVHGTDANRTDTITPRGGHFIKEDLSLFDAPFFSITSAEATSMDVQQRQLLECVYRALENAGMPLDKVNGSKTSVHTGSFSDDYRLMTMRDHQSLPKYAATVPPTAIQLAQGAVEHNNTVVLDVQDQTKSNPALLAWSSTDQGGLDRLSKAYKSHFQTLSSSTGQSPTYLSDLAYTLSQRRSIFPWKSCAIANSTTDLRNGSFHLSKAVRSTRELGIAYIFTGQGAQFAGMGRELLAYPVFKNTLQRAQLYLYELGCPWSLMEELLMDKASSRVSRADMSQPLCTALQIALITLLQSWDITPRAVVGHSSGEIAAAYCLGGLSLRSACKVAYLRGKLAAKLATASQKKCAMMAAGLSKSRALEYIKMLPRPSGPPGIVVACVNSPSSVTISGDAEQIDALHQLLVRDSVFARKLQVDVGYHSPQMEYIAGEYQREMSQLELGTALPGCSLMISSVTKQPIKHLQQLSDGNYWVSNLISPVRFSDALDALVSLGAKTGRKKLGAARDANSNRETVTVYDLLELGPHGALGGPVKDILKSNVRGKEVRYASCLTRNVSSLETLMGAAGRLWCQGYPVQISKVSNFQAGKPSPRMALTDLPEYPFDHSQSYWHESRSSKEGRLRKHARHDLLGTRTNDGNPLEACWRNFIRTSEVPWVADHVVNGSTIYPAAGMLAMALEGVRQLEQDNTLMNSTPVKGFRVTEATFRRVLSIDVSTADAATESHLYVCPVQDAGVKKASRFDFRICTLERGQWGENCRGQIEVEYEDEEQPDEIDGGLEQRSADEAMARLLESRTKTCTQQVGTPAVYDHFGKMGLQFGPTFQSLQRVQFNESGEVLADVKAFRWEADDGKANAWQPHLIHPTTLDSFIQVVLVGLTKGASKAIPTTVPTRVTNLWLSSSGLAHPETSSLQVTSHELSRGNRQTESSFAAYGSDGHLRASVAVIETTNVDRQEAEEATDQNGRLRRLCYKMDWKPDFDLLSPTQGAMYFGVGKTVNASTSVFYEDLACFIYSTITRILLQLNYSHVVDSKKEYVAWMEQQVQRFNEKPQLPPWSCKISDATYQEALAHRLGEGSEGRFYVKVAQNLLPILYGEMDPQQLLLSGDLAREYHLEVNSRLSGVLAGVVDLLAHKNPNLRILEVGAGAGGVTAHIAGSLFPSAGSTVPRCARYDFTDAVPSLLEKAQKDFPSYSSRMRYTLLDIEKDPQEQGFEPGTYDLVIATNNTARAQKNLAVPLQNVHALLRTGGKLLLLVHTGNIGRSDFAYGLLPGSPCLSALTPEKWNQTLVGSGFSGNDFVLDDYADVTNQELSIIVSTKVDGALDSLKSLSPPHRRISLVTTRGSVTQAKVASQIQSTLSTEYGVVCETSFLDALKSSAGKALVFLVELDSPVLHNLDEKTFETLRASLLSAEHLVWVTGGGDDWDTPEYHVADGLLRGLRTENAMLKAVTLAANPSQPNVAEVVQEMVHSVFVCGDANDLEAEYRDQNGILFINRAVEDSHLNEHVHTTIQPQQTQVQPFGTPGLPPLGMQFKTPGLLDSLQFVEDTAAKEALQPDDVEIQVKAVGVNFRDLLTALGRINQLEIGCECAGVISRVGSAVDPAHLRVGDRVCAIAFDCYRTLARTNALTVVKIPDQLSFTEAAALPITYATAHYALLVVGRIRKGDRVLIHAAAGGTGQAAIQLAQLAGAEVFATVSSQAKKRLLVDRYGVAGDHIFYSRNTSFAQGVMRMTQNRGVDLVLNSLAGDGLTASWKCMASFGRFVEIGKRDIDSHSRLDMFYFMKNVSFTAVDLFAMTKERPALVRESLAAALEVIAAGQAKTSYPVQPYPVSEIESAFRYMQSGKSIGKLVIEMRSEENVLTVLDRKPSLALDPNATYVIAGGFGGIARPTVQWMADRGALHLVLLSRSGPQSASARKLVEDLESRGVQVFAPQCDVTSTEALAPVLVEVAATMPPIKGCIQAAMVLRDTMLDRVSAFQMFLSSPPLGLVSSAVSTGYRTNARLVTVTHADWTQALRPKVDGTRALDQLMPAGLDFFVILSSVVGIHGSAGQSNYAAGGTYQDALAKRRVRRGERAVALDLGWMASFGVISESAFLTRAFEASGLLLPIGAAEYLALLEHCCRADNPRGRDVDACQVVVGMETPAGLRAKGADVAALLQRSTFRYLHAMGPGEGQDTDEGGGAVGDGVPQANAAKNWYVAFASARSAAEAEEVVVEGLVHKLSRALSMAPEDIDHLRPLHSYGVDSLLAVELRSWFAKEFKSDIAVFEIMGAANFGAIAATVKAKSKNTQVSRAEE